MLHSMLKKCCILCVICSTVLFTTYLYAEEDGGASANPVGKKNVPETETLFQIDDNVSFSGYGAVYVHLTRINDTTATLVGGRGGLIINDSYVIGAAGMGLAHPRDREDLSGEDYTGDLRYVDFGYGGGLLEYYFMPKKLINFSIGTVIGGGGFRYSSERDNDGDDDNVDSDIFFVVEPEIRVCINLTKFCRVGVGGSYRYINGIDQQDFDDNDFSGFNVSFMAAFGWF